MFRINRRTAAAAAALVAGVVLMPAVASADSLLVEPGDAPLDFDGLAPGFDRTGSFSVRNGSEAEATVSLLADITGEAENGCAHPETYVPTEGCEDDGGELSEWLVVTVTRDGTTLWSGPMQDLADTTQLPGTIPAGEEWDLDFTVGMPIEAGNDTMTDQVSFDLTVRAESDLGEDEADIAGVEATSGGNTGNTASTSGATGVTGVPTVVAAGLTAIAEGGLATLGVDDGGLLAPALLAWLGLAVLVLALVRASRRQSTR